MLLKCLRQTNTKIQNLLEIRPVYVSSRSKSQKMSKNEQKEFVKFYSDQKEDYNDRYKSLSDDDYSRYYSKRALTRKPALTRLITALSYKVGTTKLSLAEGMPNEDVFPFSKVQVTMKNGTQIHIDGKELATGLQYVPSQGLPSLIESLRDFQTLLHRPPPHNRGVCIANGAQHAIYQCFELFLNIGDPIIVTEYAYTGSQVALNPYEPEILGIPEDENGMRTDVLESMLSTRLQNGLKMPKVLYIIPTGNNPTGRVLPEDRRRHIYELACRYDFLILEDDPYMFLKYVETPTPSFLSLDSCGRVIRMDSFSKVVSAGLRLGWVTGPVPVLQRLELHTQAEMLHSCSLSQTIMNRVVSDLPSLASHLDETRAFYQSRRDALQRALINADASSVADWVLPDAGLFIWLKVKGVDDVYDMVFQRALQRGLILLPGQAFMYHTDSNSQYIRLTFSKIPVEQMDTAVSLLVDIIKNEQKNSKSKRSDRFATAQ